MPLASSKVFATMVEVKIGENRPDFESTAARGVDRTAECAAAQPTVSLRIVEQAADS
jgi:hypothetical protein